MKKCLPSTTKVSKDAKECVQECTSEFISFITSEAAERCELEKRKTINGEVSPTNLTSHRVWLVEMVTYDWWTQDILFAMMTLGFENYSDALRIYLAKYREVSHHNPLFSACLPSPHGVCKLAHSFGDPQHQRTTGKRVGKKAARAAAEAAAAQAASGDPAQAGLYDEEGYDEEDDEEEE